MAEADDINTLWRKYQKTRDQEIRNRLIENYLSYVKYIAERVCAKLPSSVDVNDMISAGIFGLMDAVDAFDPDRGVRFETYCITRIRGSIIDELRNMDWVPRLVRSRAHKIEQAYQELERKLGRDPTDMEMAGHIGIPVEEYEEMAKEATASTIFSCGRSSSNGEDNEDLHRVESLESRKTADPVEEIYRKEVMEIVTAGLSKKEQLVLVLYYFDDLTMKEIGAILDLSESRVCQIHSQILIRLKAQLLRHKNEFLP